MWLTGQAEGEGIKARHETAPGQKYTLYKVGHENAAMVAPIRAQRIGDVDRKRNVCIAWGFQNDAIR